MFPEIKEVLFSFLLTLVFTPIIIKFNILDYPNSRKIHHQPIPKAGGIGIYLTMVITTLVFQYSLLDFGILVVLGLMTLLGLKDDLHEIRKGSTKLFLLLMITVLALIMGFRFSLPFQITSWLLSLVWILSYVNCFNLIDGMDGLAGGLGIIEIANLLFLAWAGSAKSSILPLGLMVIGATAGFLVYNFHPAKIFLGDTGSLLIGSCIALIAIKVQAGFPGGVWFNQIVGIGLITGYPIFDTIQCILRRAKRDRPIMEADRSHTYNLMVDQYKISTRKTVLLIYLISLMLGIIGQIVFISHSLFISVTVLVTVVLVGIYFLNKGLGVYSKKDSHFKGGGSI